MESLVNQIEVKREFGELVCQQLTICIEKIGFTDDIILSYPNYQTARFELVEDPFTRKLNLSGYWYDHHQQKIGWLQFQSDDSCYAEYDVGKLHPSKPQWFVNNVIAWGKFETLKTEPQLLKFPD